MMEEDALTYPKHINMDKDQPDNRTFYQKYQFIILAYTLGTVATVIKTVAWWFNQWPFISDWNFFAKWGVSAGIAGFEYAPLTLAFTAANTHGVHLGLMTAYMEAADNLFRMLQQLFLSDPLAWFDWIGALGLGLCVAWQGYMHWNDDRKRKLNNQQSRQEEEEAAGKVATPTTSHAPLTNETATNEAPTTEDGTPMDFPVEVIESPQGSDARNFCCGLDRERFLIASIGTIILIVGSPTIALEAGPTGQAYVCATLATAAKTFAWWINQYPQLKHLNFYRKWLAGWSIAAFIEYLPLIGAFTIASSNDVHLGLMTAYMEALDNFFRILQQRMLRKPLAWYDYLAALGMFISVGFQGGTRFAYDRGANIPG